MDENFDVDYFEASIRDRMTLRDQFAIASLKGTLSLERAYSDTVESIAEYSYRLADAMIKAREK